MAEAVPAVPAAPSAAAPVATPAPATPPVAASSPEPAAPATPTGPTAAASEPASPVVSEAAPIAEAPVAEKPAEKAKSFIGDATAKEAEKPAETTEKPVEAKPAETTLPAYEPFKFPEGVQVEQGRVTEFGKLLGEFETTAKVDHSAAQAFGQRLVDFHVAEVQKVAEALAQQQWDAFHQQNERWTEELHKDPELGGNRAQTTAKTIGALIDRYGSEMGADREGALRMVFNLTGAGNNPEVARFLNWAAQNKVERAKPVAAIVPRAPVVQSRAHRRYNNSSGNGAA